MCGAISCQVLNHLPLNKFVTDALKSNRTPVQVFSLTLESSRTKKAKEDDHETCSDSCGFNRRSGHTRSLAHAWRCSAGISFRHGYAGRKRAGRGARRDSQEFSASA